MHFSPEVESGLTPDAKEEYEMIAIDTLLFGLVAGLVGFKVVLLAAAALLFMYGVTRRSRQQKLARVKAPVRRPKLDVHA